MHTPSSSKNFRAGAATLAMAAMLGASMHAQTPQLDWQLELVPPSRNQFTMVRHEGIDATVLFGGEAGEVMDDTWLWRDGWQRVESPQSPSRRRAAGMAYDSLRQRVVLFGGTTTQSTLGETWVFDGVAWTQLFPPQSPPARHGHAMGYDAVRDRIVIKGGLAAPLGAALGDLWEFDGATWQVRTQAGSDPGTGYVGQFVHDAARQELLLLGSAVTAWNGTTWVPRSTLGLPSPSGQACYDSVGQRVLLFVTSAQNPGLQEVYGYAGLGWTLAAVTQVPSDRVVILAYDSMRAEAVGLRPSLGIGNDDRSHTYAWRGVGQVGSAGWQRVRSGLPPGRRSAAMGYDPVRRHMVLHGGGEGIFTVNDIYEADDRAWLPRLPLGGPGVEGHGMVYDAGGARMLLFGSASGSSGIRTWDGVTLGFVSGSNALAQRWYNALAYDSSQQRLIVFGGETALGLTAELWAWTGSAWTNVPGSGPSPRRYPSLCFDAARNRLVMFGGTDGVTFFGDTWEHDGVSWLQCNPTTSPPARAGAVLVHANHLKCCVLVGGFDAQDRRDTWLWDGIDWMLLKSTKSPDTGTGVCGAYDPDRREVLLFGGGTFLGPNPRRNRGELWRLRDPSLAVWTPSGVGCDAGAGPLQLRALDPPALDTTCEFELQNTPGHFFALPLAWLGFNDLPQPFGLAGLGGPACYLWADIQISIPMLPLGLHASGSFVIPDLPAMIGLRLFLQGAVWDFATSTIATADLLTGVVGPL